MRFFSYFANNAYVKMFVGVTLVGTVIMDLFVSGEHGVTSAHGLLFFGLQRVLAAFAEFQHGATELVEGAARRRD